MKRAVAALLVCALLAGCATKPNGDLDDQSCVPPVPDHIGGGGEDAVVVLAALLLIDLTWFAGCETVVGISNGIHHLHRAATHAGYYYAPDGAFSVAVPGGPDSDGYEAQQQVSPGRDAVVFVPHTGGDPVFGVVVLTRLTPEQAAMSADDFAKATAGLLPGTAAAGQAPPLTPIHAEDIQLGANPARLVVFRSESTRAQIGEPRYYILYFVKTPHSAAVLSVAWPFECERCATGPDAALRGMDSKIAPFLDSFELRNPG